MLRSGFTGGYPVRETPSRSDTKNSVPGVTITFISRLAGVLAGLGLGWLALGQDPPPAGNTSMDALADARAVLTPCVMDRDGYWRGRLFANSVLDIDLAGAELACAGNARPDDRGLRLFFAGHPGRSASADQEGSHSRDEDRLLLVVGIPAGVEDLAGQEHSVSVTLIDEASKQFFHSPGERCFSHIDQVRELPGAAGSYRVDGELYCVGAIAAFGSNASVTIGDTAYSGRLVLDQE